MNTDRPFVHYIDNFNATDAYWDAMADLIKAQGKLGTVVSRGWLKQELLKANGATHVWECMFTRRSIRLKT